MTLDLEIKAPDDWEQKVTWARARGLTRADWDGATGALITIELGPVPPEPGEEDDAEPPPPARRPRRSHAGIIPEVTGGR